MSCSKYDARNGKMYRMFYVYPKINTEDKSIIFASWTYEYYKFQQWNVFEVDQSPVEFFEKPKCRDDCTEVGFGYHIKCSDDRNLPAEVKYGDKFIEPTEWKIDSWDGYAFKAVSYPSYEEFYEADLFVCFKCDSPYWVHFVTKSVQNQAIWRYKYCYNCRKHRCKGCPYLKFDESDFDEFKWWNDQRQDSKFVDQTWDFDEFKWWNDQRQDSKFSDQTWGATSAVSSPTRTVLSPSPTGTLGGTCSTVSSSTRTPLSLGGTLRDTSIAVSRLTRGGLRRGVLSGEWLLSQRASVKVHSTLPAECKSIARKKE